MSLAPKISAVYNIDENEISIKDITGFFDSQNNPGGYKTPNISRDDVAYAYIEIETLQGTKRINVTDEVKYSTDAEIQFELLSLETEPEGHYYIKYVVSANNEEYIVSIDLYILEILKRIISRYWAIYAANIDVYKKKDMEEECHWLEMSLLGMEALIELRKIPEYVNLYNFARKRTLNNKELFGFQNVIKLH